MNRRILFMDQRLGLVKVNDLNEIHTFSFLTPDFSSNLGNEAAYAWSP